MKLSLKSKFYILVLPSAVVLVLLMVMLMLPHGGIQSDVTQIKQALGEVVAAESFARHYEHQLKECAAFIASGSAAHEQIYEQALKDAAAGIDGWILAENRHTGDPATEHADEFKTLGETKKAYRGVTTVCDNAIALAKSGRAPEAAAILQAALDGSDGSTVEDNISEQLPEEEAQLNRYLDNLAGAVKTLFPTKLLGLDRNVTSMRAHVTSAVLAQRFARHYESQVRNTLAFIMTAQPQYLDRITASAAQASQALEQWTEQNAILRGEKSPGGTTAAANSLDRKYKVANAANEKALGLAKAGDAAGALAIVEKEIGTSPQSGLTTTTNKDVEAQRRSLELDADHISSSSRNSTWGVGIVGGLLVLVALGGTLLVSRTVVGPVVQLRDAAKKFGEGGGEVDVAVRSHDEIGELAESFNEMAAARFAAELELLNARDLLEVRVEERTRDLEHANEELKASERKFRQLAETLPQVVFEVDSQGKISYVNENAYSMFGYTPEDVAERRLGALDIIDEPDRERVAGAIGKMMDGTSTGAVREYAAKRKDGTTFPCIVYSTLVTDANGNPAGVRGILTDMTERHEMDKALRASEERYRELFTNASEGIFQTTPEGRVINANPAFAAMFGYESPEQVKLEVTDIATQLYADPADRERLIRLLDEEGFVQGTEMKFKRRDGTTLWVSLNVHVERDASGAVIRFEGTTEDITATRRARKRLRLTQFEVDGATDLIVRVGSSGRIAYANEAAAMSYGYPVDELMGMNIWDISPNFPEDEWPALLDAIQVMGTLRLETVARHRTGQTFPIEANISHLSFEGKEYVVVFGRDATERRQSELRQERLNEELLATNKELNDFAYVVSHDLKAPLRGIGSLASWLATDYAEVLDDAGRRQLDLLLERAKRMESLIESVLQYSRVGRLRESRERVDLNDLVASAIDMIAPPDNIKIVVDGTLPSVLCERTRMAQVLQNLVGNAVKFMDKPDGEVVISCVETPTEYRFSVRDNGPGIDPRYHEQIFQIFQTLSTAEDMESTGIGLTLVKKIVEMHGGRVWVESSAGKGSTFFFTLPRE